MDRVRPEHVWENDEPLPRRVALDVLSENEQGAGGGPSGGELPAAALAIEPPREFPRMAGVVGIGCALFVVIVVAEFLRSAR